jgi:hypothetical protein
MEPGGLGAPEGCRAVGGFALEGHLAARPGALALLHFADQARDPPLFLDGFQLLLVDGPPAGQELEEDRAEAEDVGPRIHAPRARVGLLGTHVGEGPDDPVGIHGDRSGGEDVRGLQVPVDDRPLVGVLDRIAGLEEEAQALPDVQSVPVAEGREGLTGDVLHGEEGAAIGGLPGLVEAGDPGVLEEHEDAALPLEPSQYLGAAELRPEDLEGDLFPDRLALEGEEDLPESSLADLP